MFIIKKHYEATEANTNFAGDVFDTYYGKDEIPVSPVRGEPIGWLVRKYGYKTKAAASRGLKHHKELADWETTNGWWNVTASLVEIQV